MQFNTYIFILAFLPLTIIGYFLLGKFNWTVSKIFLVISSIFFYGYVGLQELIWLMISMVVNYIFIIMFRKITKSRKIILLVGIAFNIILLFYFKYYNFTILSVNCLFDKNFSEKNILLPLGISFFTFQQIAYLVESYKDETKKDSLLDYVLYVVYFPKLLMGPITSSRFLLKQFHNEEKREIQGDNLIKGIRMFNIGLFKKVLIADTFAKAVQWGFTDIASKTSMDIILIMIAYSFQIYFDFSGYSDMANGSSLMLNIELPINFDSPYKAFSIRDFWRRWHISLTTFLTQYIYIPLGGNKKGRLRTYINTMIVFTISGLWHGANWTFILWGILHGALCVWDRITEKFRVKMHPAMQWILTMGAISLLWLLFRAESISQWTSMLFHMLAFENTNISGELINIFVLPEMNFWIEILHLQVLNSQIRGFSMLVFYVSAMIICLGFENTYKRKYENKIWSPILSAVLFVCSLTCISSESVFVYFNF